MIDQALLDRVQKQAWFHKYPRGWPFLLFIIASITTAVSVMAIERADRQTRQVELDRNLTEIASALQRRTTENIALLRAGAALFATQREVSEDQFRAFAQDLQGKGDLYGSLGMGWAPIVAVDRLSEMEMSIQAAGRADFLVYPRPTFDRTTAAPIVYLEPDINGNGQALGYDMFSEEVRRAAMERAMKLGKPVASGKVHLVQDESNAEAAGFLIYMPVLSGRSGRQVKGFVFSPFRAETFLTSASELYRNNNIDVAIYDGEVAPDKLLAERRADGSAGPTMERRIDVGSHSWVVVISDRKVGVLSTASRITLFFGALASLMVMAIGRLITRRSAEDRMVLEWLQSQAAIRNSLTRELNHRVKNTLANVLSIAALTRRRATDIDDFTESLTARIRALSATHDLLSQSDWTHAVLGDVVRSELAPYMEGNESHVEMSGPEVRLAPNDAMSLGLAIHELATNAAKYGALSTTGGRIHVHWILVSPELAEIDWREEGGPPVVEPAKRGFGRDLIEKIVAHELKSDVDLRFKPSGVECRLKVPVRASREFTLRNDRR
ncbi:CHASE domain-containing protein [Novosphingobium aerophilum]|uniref:CHASE domain-containing protein n=1 Tax=Novosphingobium TaxID=165696 RepID=UPI001047010E|nr:MULTISPECIES: CHASE domain-containing protein [unclassified Novosphingobium]MPS71040.1 histidine kinase [Novosphingobium sp.]TCM38399.1 two-component sensor histidine kinase [Novosphingobium sp. ST904]WRT92586.1 CHASE domain-containing protein [Novosphingobium sp. RL4]